MRLINIDTLRLESYTGTNAPPYVRLSHRWSSDELLFEEYDKLEKRNSVGWKKIIGLCNFVREDSSCRSRRVHHVWCDTVCIDKRSSAELSEAINSMGSIYANCVLCVAHLVDVDHTNFEAMPFQGSQWFSRCWTLQELLFPREVIFVGFDWVRLGSKCDKDFVGRVARASNVPEECLLQNDRYRFYSVASRMSWASRRSATRIEDEAYSLLGLFNINMPLLYGEGAKAFQRLQTEIIGQSSDESIFAWSLRDDVQPQTVTDTSVLARNIRDFHYSSHVERADLHRREPYVVTNQGLRLRSRAFQVYAAMVWKYRDVCLFELNCTRPMDLDPKIADMTGFAKRACLMVFKETHPGSHRRIPLTLAQESRLYQYMAQTSKVDKVDILSVIEDRVFYLDVGIEPALAQRWLDRQADSQPLTLMNAYEMRNKMHQSDEEAENAPGRTASL